MTHKIMKVILDTGVLGQLIQNNPLVQYSRLKNHLQEGDYKGFLLNPIIQECALHLANDYPRDVSLSLIISIIHTYDLQLITPDLSILNQAGRLKRRFPHLSACDSLILTMGVQKSKNFSIHSTDGKMFHYLDDNTRNKLKYKVYCYDQDGKTKINKQRKTKFK
ncbi:MAG: hypothetical protein ACTSRK_18630 [Promethearchaeota archaeon]